MQRPQFPHTLDVHGFIFRYPYSIRSSARTTVIFSAEAQKHTVKNKIDSPLYSMNNVPKCYIACFATVGLEIYYIHVCTLEPNVLPPHTAFSVFQWLIK